MGKKLIKALGLIALGAGLTGALSYGPKYQIGESKVKDRWISLYDLVEYKGEDKIKYCHYLFSDKLAIISINGNKYATNDKINTIICLEGDKRYKYLKEQIDSAKSAIKISRTNARIKNKQMKRNKDLEILRK